MGIQRVMDRTGDSRHDFDVADPVSLGEAEKRFKELTGSGFITAEKTAQKLAVAGATQAVQRVAVLRGRRLRDR
jgi:hypothetical protein